LRHVRARPPGAALRHARRAREPCGSLQTRPARRPRPRPASHRVLACRRRPRRDVAARAPAGARDPRGERIWRRTQCASSRAQGSGAPRRARCNASRRSVARAGRGLRKAGSRLGGVRPHRERNDVEEDLLAFGGHERDESWRPCTARIDGSRPSLEQRERFSLDGAGRRVLASPTRKTNSCFSSRRIRLRGGSRRLCVTGGCIEQRAGRVVRVHRGQRRHAGTTEAAEAMFAGVDWHVRRTLRAISKGRDPKGGCVHPKAGFTPTSRPVLSNHELQGLEGRGMREQGHRHTEVGTPREHEVWEVQR
jgi:hypothetical protein